VLPLVGRRFGWWFRARTKIELADLFVPAERATAPALIHALNQFRQTESENSSDRAADKA
jgi:hypothetical protein